MQERKDFIKELKGHKEKRDTAVKQDKVDIQASLDYEELLKIIRLDFAKDSNARVLMLDAHNALSSDEKLRAGRIASNELYKTPDKPKLIPLSDIEQSEVKALETVIHVQRELKNPEASSTLAENYFHLAKFYEKSDSKKFQENINQAIKLKYVPAIIYRAEQYYFGLDYDDEKSTQQVPNVLSAISYYQNAVKEITAQLRERNQPNQSVAEMTVRAKKNEESNKLLDEIKLRLENLCVACNEKEVKEIEATLADINNEKRALQKRKLELDEAHIKLTIPTAAKLDQKTYQKLVEEHNQRTQKNVKQWAELATQYQPKDAKAANSAEEFDVLMKACEHGEATSYERLIDYFTLFDKENKDILSLDHAYEGLFTGDFESQNYCLREFYNTFSRTFDNYSSWSYNRLSSFATTWYKLDNDRKLYVVLRVAKKAVQIYQEYNGTVLSNDYNSYQGWQAHDTTIQKNSDVAKLFKQWFFKLCKENAGPVHQKLNSNNAKEKSSVAITAAGSVVMFSAPSSAASIDSKDVKTNSAAAAASATATTTAAAVLLPDSPEKRSDLFIAACCDPKQFSTMRALVEAKENPVSVNAKYSSGRTGRNPTGLMCAFNNDNKEGINYLLNHPEIDLLVTWNLSAGIGTAVDFAMFPYKWKQDVYDEKTTTPDMFVRVIKILCRQAVRDFDFEKFKKVQEYIKKYRNKLSAAQMSELENNSDSRDFVKHCLKHAAQDFNVATYDKIWSYVESSKRARTITEHGYHELDNHPCRLLMSAVKAGGIRKISALKSIPESDENFFSAMLEYERFLQVLRPTLRDESNARLIELFSKTNDTNMRVRIAALLEKAPDEKAPNKVPNVVELSGNKKLEAEGAEKVTAVNEAQRSHPDMKKLLPENYLRLYRMYKESHPEKSYTYLEKSSELNYIPALLEKADNYVLGLDYEKEATSALPKVEKAVATYQAALTQMVEQKEGDCFNDIENEIKHSHKKLKPERLQELVEQKKIARLDDTVNKLRGLYVALGQDEIKRVETFITEIHKKQLVLQKLKVTKLDKSKQGPAWFDCVAVCRASEGEDPVHYQHEAFHALIKACEFDFQNAYPALTHYFEPLDAKKKEEALGCVESFSNESNEEKNIIFCNLSCLANKAEMGWIKTTSAYTAFKSRWDTLDGEQQLYAQLELMQRAIQFYSSKTGFFDTSYRNVSSYQYSYYKNYYSESLQLQNNTEIANFFKTLFLKLCQTGKKPERAQRLSTAAVMSDMSVRRAEDVLGVAAISTVPTVASVATKSASVELTASPHMFATAATATATATASSSNSATAAATPTDHSNPPAAPPNNSPN